MKRHWQPAVCILSLLSIAACAATPGSTQPAIRRFEPEIAAFERADLKSPPPKDAVLFIGSSTFAMWGRKLPEDFKPLVAINRGFGGSTMNDLLVHMDRIVIPYKPRAIVVYCGENDIAAGNTPEQVLENVRKFVARARAALPNVHIYYISMKPSPSRWRMWDRMSKGNDLIRQFAVENHVVYIDTTAVMMKDGKPDASLFTADMLHMNRSGYERWIPVIREALKE
jgi:lysophospholipase L1-like esterase